MKGRKTENRKAEDRREKPAGASTAAAAGFEGYITKLTVAERLGVEVHTVARLMRGRVLQYYRVGPLVRFKWSEVEEDLRKHCLVRGGAAAEANAKSVFGK